jgi:hypothetical protein
LVNSNFNCQDVLNLPHEIDSEFEIAQDLFKSNKTHPKVQLLSLNSINSPKKSFRRKFNIALVNDVHFLDKNDLEKDLN